MSKIISRALKNNQIPSEDTIIVCAFSGLAQQLRALVDFQGTRVECLVPMQKFQPPATPAPGYHFHNISSITHKHYRSFPFLMSTSISFFREVKLSL